MNRRRTDMHKFVQNNHREFLVSAVKSSGELNDHEVEIVSRQKDPVIVILAKTAIDNAELRKLASHDSLTGLLNPRGMEAGINGLDGGGMYAVGNIDLRKMKEVNDENTHAEGNAYLIGTAKAVVANLRLGSLVARVGGDEFSIVVPIGRQVDVEADETVSAIEERLSDVLGGDGVGTLCRLNADISTYLSARVAFVASDKAGIWKAFTQTDEMLGEIKNAEEMADPHSRRGVRGVKRYVDNKTGAIFVKS